MKVSPDLEAAILAQATAVNGVPVQHAGGVYAVHTPSAKPKRPTPVATSAPPRLVIEFDIPARTKSEANAGGSLRGSIARKSQLKSIAEESLPRLAMPFPLPCRVTMTRYGVKKLDEDNLGRALKSVRDVVAKWLGVDDGDEGPRGRVTWRPRQAASWVPFVRVRVETTS
jgi:hypothetical protein